MTAAPAQTDLEPALDPDRHNTVTPRNVTTFAVVSALGLALFLLPIPTGDGAFTIPLGLAIGWLESSVFAAAPFDVAQWLLVAIISVSALGSLVVAVSRRTPRNHYLARAFTTQPLYLASRLFAAAAIWMIVTGWGPELLVSDVTGGVMLGITGHLVAVFVFLGFAIPLLTDFGVMEFIGALVFRVVRRLFTLPGRASVDLVASWFGSSLAAVLLTRDQHEKNHYTGREAAVICTNFAFVSIPFSLFVASAIGIEGHFVPWYLLICAVALVLAVVTPRMWPLKSVPDTYLDSTAPEAVRGATAEVVPAGHNAATWGLRLAPARAASTRPRDVVRSGLRAYVDIYLDLIPLILGWGVLALAVFEFTPVFQWISTPMGWYLSLFGVEGAMTYAPATLIGFLDMFLPAVLLGGAETALTTQLMLGALSIVQIIYLTETGISILKSRIPISLGKLFAVFMIRTLIAIPLLALGVHLVF